MGFIEPMTAGGAWKKLPCNKYFFWFFMGTNENINDWLKKVLDTVERQTKEIQLNEVAPAVHTHHLPL